MHGILNIGNVEGRISKYNGGDRYFTKFALAFPRRNQTAKTIANILLNQCIVTTEYLKEYTLTSEPISKVKSLRHCVRLLE